ncbi:MAG: inner-rane translocator [Frankiales bacterium]|jgi:ABC-type branched-subunit amino acid transport system ATPase component/ABC-type branched-subunit amino acid transport system permease subunit|nr:inner-rane translocator [Frankiales bacterium]
MTSAAVRPLRLQVGRLPVPWTVVALLLAAVVPPLAGGTALLSDTHALVLAKGAGFAMAALSLNLLMGYAGQISLGQFAFVGIGAFVTGMVTGVEDLRLPWLVGVLAAAAAGGLLAFLVGLPALRLRGLYLAVVTISVAYVCWQGLFRIESIGGGSAGKVIPRPYVGSSSFSSNADFLALALVALVVVWAVDAQVTRTRIGRAFRAVKADEQVAASFGIDVAATKLLAFTLAGAMAGVGGAVYGTAYGTVTGDTFDYATSLLLVVIVVVGGLGSRAGVVIAAFFTVLLPDLLVALFGSGIRGLDLVLNGVLLMLTVAFNPEGMAGAVRHSRELRRQRRGGEPPLPPTRPHLPDLGRPAGMPAPRKTRPGTAVLEARGVSVRFGGLQAVDGASLRVDRGTIVGLMGPNGAGKTTLFNALSGALTPDSGTVHFLGEDVSALPPHARAARGMGRTFQLIGLAKDQSVYENLLIAQHLAAPYGVLAALTSLGSRGWEKQVRERADHTLDGLGFGRFRNTPVGRLSHGQQRIVEIGCALVTSPELLMLDEPSAGMSPAAAEDLAATLLDIRDQLGRTVLLIEHNVPLVLGTADELYVMDTGRVIADGEPGEVVTRPEVVTAYLGQAVTA